VFEKVGYFPNFGTVVCESVPFHIVFAFFVVHLMVSSVALQLAFEVNY